jgi:NAD+ synthase (glutamine-hydrolysing)
MELHISHPEYEPREDFIRVATATPEVAVGDTSANINCIYDLYKQAADQKASLVVFPELSITGYSIQDFMHQPELLHDAQQALVALADASRDLNSAAVVGLPLAVGNGIYNCAAVVADGELKGIIPKQNMPNYNEFYEKRWFQAWDDRDNVTIKIGDKDIPFGRNQLFEIAGSTLGVEICEDLWVPDQPSIGLVSNGANLIANPSASPETVTKGAYRRQLVGSTAARLIAGYIYTSADASESVSDIVMSGHAMINESGRMLAERTPLSRNKERLLMNDIDISHIMFDRRKTTNYPVKNDITPTPTHVTALQGDLLRDIDPLPFIPKDPERLDEILAIQATGLARKLSESGIPRVILGLSGGLDSTLALLVAVRAAEILDRPAGDVIYTLTMPAEASSDRTQNNAVQLARSLGIPNEEIPIAALADSQLEAMGHGGNQDVTFENTHARLRQAFVFNKGNQIGALALGTGDLSEIALGWCTYNGDQMSGYNPNASIPKTLVRSLVARSAAELDATPRAIIEDILDTPISPELTGDGNTVSQKTEDIIGPYELHDFFMYNQLRWMDSKRKLGFMAMKAFENIYQPEEINKWLDVFVNRFYGNQWKRQAMPDGAKVGLSLSPRGDWRMPPSMARSANADQLREKLIEKGVLETRISGI